MRFREWRFWSIERDCDCVRLMVADYDGREHFAVVEAGRGYRERRDAALTSIGEAIADGSEPGEVVL